MGHEVVELQENFTQPDHLTQRLQGEEFDLFLFTRTWGETLKTQHLQLLNQKNIPSASYHLDLYHGLQRDGGVDTDPFWRTDFVFTPDGDPRTQKFFRGKGINHYYMKPGVLAEECALVENPRDKAVIFVGSYDYHPEWQYRPQLIDWLRNTYGGAFELWGSHGMGLVRQAELNQLYGRTKVVIGDSLHLPGNEWYWSDRVYETLGRGGFLIHPLIEGLREEFEDRVHLCFYDYGNFGQLKELIDHYLTNDEEREKIRHAGHELVKNNYTYTHRLTQMLETVANARGKK